MKEEKCQKALNFDLDTNKLKEYYPKKNYRQAYNDIKKFMKKEGFIHRQGSGYLSKKILTTQKIVLLSKRMSKTFPWLKNCVQRFDVTNVGERLDLTYMITGDNKIQIQDKNLLKTEIKNNTEEVSKDNEDNISKIAFNFDLDTNSLKKYYPKSNYIDAYKDVMKVLNNQGFSHRQYSGYIADKPMKDYQINNIIDMLVNELPWLKQCVNKFDVTEIGEQHDLTHLIINDKVIKEQTKSENVRETKSPYITLFELDSHEHKALDTYRLAFESGQPKNRTSFLSADITVKKEKSLSELSAYAKEQYQKQGTEQANENREISSDKDYER